MSIWHGIEQNNEELMDTMDNEGTHIFYASAELNIVYITIIVESCGT